MKTGRREASREKECRIAVVIENSSEYGRRLINGVAEFARTRYAWRLVWGNPRKINEGQLAECDGIIARVATDDMARRLLHAGKPVIDVFCARERPGFHGVDSDHVEIGRIAARHFLAKRYVSMAFAGFTGVAFSSLRFKGFAEVLRDKGIEPLIYEVPMKSNKAFFIDKIADVVDSRALGRWISKLPRQTAVFTADDLMAVQVIATAERRGVQTPADIAVLGVDDDRQLCSFSGVPVSSIDPDAFAVGFAAARALSAVLERPPDMKPHPVYRVRPKGLVERTSTQRHAMSPEWLADALGFIDASLERPLSAADVVSRAGLSHVAVAKMFRRKLGMGPQRYIASVKMEAACRMLESDGSLRVKEVASRVGYPSFAHFCSAYRKYWGHAPRGS